MKVVVVDDDLSQRLYLSAAVRGLGHDVIAAENAAEATAALLASEADLIVCDIRMPGTDGMELTRQIRARSWNRYIYILMVTALNDAASQAAALEAGADDFMPKPTDPVVLKARLRSAERLVDYEREVSRQRQVLDEAYQLLRSDLQAAAAAQRMLLPASPQRLHDGTLASMLIPSADISGDMFNCFALAERFSGFYAADASGHGVRAALSSVALGSMISSEFFWRMAVDPELGPRPEFAVEVLDRRFGQLSFDDSYFAMFLAVLDHAENRLTYCQAGAPRPVVVRADGTVDTIGDGGYPVGLVAAAAFERATLPFAPGDRIVVCSDGVLDAIGPAGAALGEPGLEDLVRNTAGQPAADQLKAIERSLRGWSPSPDFSDDVSIIVLERASC